MCDWEGSDESYNGSKVVESVNEAFLSWGGWKDCIEIELFVDICWYEIKCDESSTL